MITLTEKLKEFAFSARNAAGVARAEGKQAREELQKMKTAGVSPKYLRDLKAKAEGCEEVASLWDLRADVADSGFWLCDPAFLGS
jgi:hypothetical protein